jgi:hypothetical protein
MTEDQQVDGRKSRKRRPRSKTGRKNHAASEALKRKWQDPEYRAKQTKHNREVLPKGRRSRARVPDGMSWEQALPLWEEATANADTILKGLEHHRYIEFNLDIEEEQMARAALREALIMALSPMQDKQTKSANIRTVLEWTMPRPAKKSELKLQGEAWLRTILEEDTTTIENNRNA